MGHPIYTGPQVARILGVIQEACGGNHDQVRQAIGSGALHRVFRGNYHDFYREELELLEEALGLWPRRHPEVVIPRVLDFKPFAVAKIGRPAAEWMSLFPRNGNLVPNDARDLMSKPIFAARTEPIWVEFVRAEVEDLGFADPNNLPTTTELLARAELLGFTVDEPQAGPAACLVAGATNYFWVLHRPITGLDDYQRIFDFCCGGDGPNLGTDYAHPGRQWRLGDQLALVRYLFGQDKPAAA